MENIIKTARETKGLTQKAVAEMLGVSMVYYGDIERGTRVPLGGILDKISAALGIPITDLEQKMLSARRARR